MKSIVEISSDRTIQAGFLPPADAFLRGSGHRADCATFSDGDGRPVFRRVSHSELVQRADFDIHANLAIDMPNGQRDLDRASAALRVIEARHHMADRALRILAFLFPDPQSLTMHIDTMRGSDRLYALAFDESALAAHLPMEPMTTPAPIVYARARSVAVARAIACPAYIRLRWSDDQDINRLLIAAAKQDGFDGIICPAEAVALINSA